MSEKCKTFAVSEILSLCERLALPGGGVTVQDDNINSTVLTTREY